MKVVAVSGVPGTGKTALSKKLAKKLNFYYLDVNKLIIRHNLSEGYDKKRKTRIVGIDRLNKFLINYIKQFKKITKKNEKYNGLIIDSHLSHYIPRKYVDLCVITKCGIKELNKRLKKKKFNKDKIKENLQAEIFGICHNEALERKHSVFVVDTTKGFNISAIAGKVGV